MTAAVENRTRLHGTVKGRRPHPQVARWDVLALEVDAAAPVPGWPNLLSAAHGDLDVAVDAAQLPEGDLTGWTFTGVVRVAGPGIVAALPAGAPGASTRLTPPVRQFPH